MTASGGEKTVALVKALAHPLRQRLLTAYNERAVSPSELADQFGEPLGNVAYHTRRLADLGCLELVGVGKGRGGLKHTYRATVRFEVEDDAWRALPRQLQGSIAARTVADIAADVAAGAAFGGFDDDDVHLSRLVFELDERGRRELSEALREMIARADAIAEGSARRGEAARRSVLAVLHFRTTST
jgi:DNA-binding transcriptional ArsR family regulator